MAMSTKTIRGEKSVDAVVTVDAILQQQDAEQKSALAQAALYTRIIEAAAAGSASTEELQAARIIGKRWNWDFDNDLSAVARVKAFDQQCPDGYQVRSNELWEQLTAKASECREYQVEARERANALESQRRNLEAQHMGLTHTHAEIERLRKNHPHLFGV